VSSEQPFDPSQWSNVAAMENTFFSALPVIFCSTCIQQPRIVPDTTVASSGYNFDLTAGDIDFDTAYELVITWIDAGVINMQVGS